MKKILYSIYGLFLGLFTWFSFAFVDQNLTFMHQFYSGFALHNRLAITIIYIIFVLLFFGFYILLIKNCKKNQIHFSDIKNLLGITCFILLFSYPTMLSYDIFNYTTTAKVLFSYHENPYIIMPIAFTTDPFLTYTHAANKIALYGPLWILLTSIPYLFGLGKFVLTLVSFKLIIVFFYLATIYLIWRFTKNKYVVVLFAFNPLIMIEISVSGHNDIVMMFFALFSFFLVKQKKIVLAICFYLASILIKYATIFLLPIFLLLLWQSYRHKQIDWNRTFFYAALSMLFIFALSPLREEMYPWYAIWFLTFSLLTPEKKSLLYFSVALSFALLLRYIPFMYLGTHFGLTPILKILLTLIPLIFVGIWFLIMSKAFKQKIKR